MEWLRTGQKYVARATFALYVPTNGEMNIPKCPTDHVVD